MGLFDWFRRRPLFPLPPRPPLTPPPAPSPPPPSAGELEELLDLHNAARRQHGGPVLSLDGRLTEAAVNHAVYMASIGLLTHVGPPGRVRPGDRIKAAGFSYSLAGENIAAGYRTAAEVVAGWMGSAGHRANILTMRFSRVGFGRRMNYWCAVFAAPQLGTLSAVEQHVFESGPLMGPDDPRQFPPS